MSVEIACTCEGLPPHTHIMENIIIQTGPQSWDATTYRDSGEVRIWVNWKAVAHALATGATGT